jgi:hypothetical protein
MRTLIITALLALGMATGFAQVQIMATSGEVDAFITGPNTSVSELIRLRVEMEINEWQRKQKTETTAEYQKRLTKREGMIREFTEAALQEFKNKQVAAIDWRFDHVDDYDADNGTYRLSINQQAYKDLVLMVPRAEVEAFDKAHAQRKFAFKNQDFILQNNTWLLRFFQVTNTLNNKTYTYDSRQRYVYNPTAFAFNFERVEIETPNATMVNNTVVGPGRTVSFGKSDVDFNLPRTQMSNPDGIAVVIGNTDYTRTKRVDYAVSDAQAMKKYLIEVMGFKEGNIFYKENATKSDFEELFGIAGDHRGRLFNAVKPDLSDVFVFYSGHGAPGLNDKRGYFVPVNSEPQTVNLTGYPADLLYDNLAKLPARHVTVVLDACFSGADLLEGVSPIVVQSKGVRGIFNGVLMASSSNDQVSAWHAEQQHGLFTYFFLKGIHSKAADYNKDGKITYAELHRFVSDRAHGVPYYARRFRNVDQIPSLDGEGFDRVLVEF